MNGKVTGINGESLPGATVIAVHTPSGTQYGTVTNADGRFMIGNMRVGGPYKVTFSYVGYDNQEKDNIILSLGNVANIDINLSEKATQISGVVVRALRSEVINSDRTGASTNVSNDLLNAVPTVSRGLRDITKLSPFASISGSGTSFAGMNNRYNQFAIDGLVNNDVFGLSSSGTNGGQTGIEPISLDAIEEYQINIAPYDVRQGGFTGGGINAVTKSGTNDFHGTVYFYGNNQSLVGQNNPADDTKSKYPEYKDFQTGLSLGGPIVKNKLFFFLNAEIDRSRSPLGSAPGTSSSNITIEEVDRVLAVLKRVAPNYDPGDYNNIVDETNSNKFLAKINYNINNKHKLVLRHSYTYGENTDNSRTANALRFYNNGQYFPSTTNSTGLELNSMFSNTITNKLSLGYTTVRDDRDPLGAAFPTVLVNLSSGRSITLGSEYSSVANQLDQNNLSLTDDITFYKGKHTITAGAHLESYKFYNLFVQNIYGSYAYNSLENFETIGTTEEVAPTYYAKSYSFQTDDDPSQANGAAEFNAYQLGFYGQDEIRVKNNFVLTAGLRLDIPMFPDKPMNNADFDSAYASKNIATGTLPDTKIMFSPRLGFNWDVFGDKSLQVRGGTGLFTGRVPFVWVSNQFTNNGQLNGTYSVGSTSSSATPISNPSGMTFNADPYDQPFAEDLGKKAGRGAINVIDKNFKFPQVFRSNIAVDKSLPWGIIATFEAIFNKTYNNINFTNINRQETADFSFSGVDKRPRYSTTSTNPTNKGYNSAARLDPNYDEIIYLQNTNKGYSYNLALQMLKQLDHGFTASVAYSYGHSEDLNSGTSSVAYSNWRYVNQVNGLNNLDVSISNYDVASRVMAFVNYKLEYLDGKLSTQVGLFYNGQSGQPLSYIYNGDMNYDGTSNDLLYIPASSSEINLVDYTKKVDGNNVTVTAAEQWTALDAYIQGDKYLSAHRGEYAERNGARLPFQHQFDFRILQEFKVKTGNVTNKFQVSLDILNVGNLINKTWGRQYLASNLACTLIDYKGLYDADSDPAVYDYSSNTPTFTYTGSSLVGNLPYSASDLYSRWRAQVGIRYIF
ncbi:MAG TPA: TonB-dependent receptor [Candidatus Cloacimonadota bacterium]|nr:TonB-dependent receptor [Candidatus Cloacimonadota bacterium]